MKVDKSAFYNYQQAVKVLFDCMNSFNLTGSRFFGNSTSASDWDFFTSANVDLVDYLKSMGFVRVREGYAETDKFVDSVWLYCYRDISVHVQIYPANLIQAKQVVQNYLKASGMLTSNLSKEEKTKIWLACMDFYLYLHAPCRQTLE